MENKEFKAGFAAKDKEFFKGLWDSTEADIKEVEDIVGTDFVVGFSAGLAFPFITSDQDSFNNDTKAYILNFAANYFMYKANQAKSAFLKEMKDNFCVIEITKDMSPEEIKATITDSIFNKVSEKLETLSEKDGNNE